MEVPRSGKWGNLTLDSKLSRIMLLVSSATRRFSTGIDQNLSIRIQEFTRVAIRKSKTRRNRIQKISQKEIKISQKK